MLKFQTSLGDFFVELHNDDAPITTKNFMDYVTSGHFDGTVFHRVIPGFMIQGGDPNSKNPDKRFHGTGGSGKNLKAEFSKTPHTRGIVSMARAANPDSASSQFFIMVDDSPHLDGQYSVFGKVVSGMDVVDRFVRVGDPSGGLDQERLWNDGEAYLASLSVKPTMIEEAVVE